MQEPWTLPEVMELSKQIFTYVTSFVDPELCPASCFSESFGSNHQYIQTVMIVISELPALTVMLLVFGFSVMFEL